MDATPGRPQNQLVDVPASQPWTRFAGRWLRYWLLTWAWFLPPMLIAYLASGWVAVAATCGGCFVLRTTFDLVGPERLAPSPPG